MIKLKRSEFREISVSRVIPAGIGPIHGYFRDMTDFKKGHAPCFLVYFYQHKRPTGQFRQS